MKLKHYLLLLICWPTMSMCQSITIKGKVVNAEGEVVAGAVVRVLSGEMGERNSQQSTVDSRRTTGERVTITDERGEFAFTDTRVSDTIIVSAVGYLPAREPNNERGVITITLKRDVRMIGDVTVSTGYQQLPKERLTGSFEKISGSQLQLQVSSDILSRLEGTSSLLFDKNVNRPGITLRGLSTINGPKGALVVVDNFPYEGDLNSINPASIASVTILKDAAAASIWGTRAGNGVIVITTHKGDYNQPLQITVNSSLKITEQPNVFYADRISSKDFITVEEFLYSKGFYNNQVTNVNRPALTPVVELLLKRSSGQLTAAEVAIQLTSLGERDVRNDFDRYIYSPSVLQQYSLQLQGGTNKAAYTFMTGYDRTQSSSGGTNERITLRSENMFKLGQRLQATAGITLTQSKGKSGKPEYRSFSKLYPYAALADSDGVPLALEKDLRLSYIDTAGGGLLQDWRYYPLSDYQHARSEDQLQSVLAKLQVNYAILKGLRAELYYQYETQLSETETIQDEESYAARNLVNRFSQVNQNNGTVKYIVPRGGIYDETMERLAAASGRMQLHYHATMGRHAFTMLGGGEVREVRNNSNRFQLYGYNGEIVSNGKVDYVNPYPTYVTGSTAYIPDNSGQAGTNRRFVSTYVNASYTFNGIYNLSGSARKDASNLFGVATNDKWTPLWSVGGSVLLSQLSFYKSTVLPYLRLRFTYGYSGNADLNRTGRTILQYNPSTASFTNYPFATVTGFNNPSLRWEQVKMLNCGIDFSGKEKKISGSVEYYVKNGIDLFGISPIDYTTGAGNSLTINVASMRGSGWDINLSSRIFDKAFKWYNHLLFSSNKSKVTDYYSTSQNGSSYLNSGQSISPQVGRPVYSLLSYAWAGLDANGNPQGLLNGVPSINYTALAGSGTKASDLIYHGPATPTVYGTMNNEWSWKGVGVTVSLLYKLGYYFRKSSVNYNDLFLNWSGHGDFARRWQQAGDEMVTNVPSMVYPNVSGRDAFYQNSSVLVEKADNIRLHFINVSYTMERIHHQKLPVQQVRFFVNGSNLGILWRATRYAIDPDYASSFIPAGKSLAAGVSVQF